MAKANAKHGRNSTACQRYQQSNRRAQNKARNLATQKRRKAAHHLKVMKWANRNGVPLVTAYASCAQLRQAVGLMRNAY